MRHDAPVIRTACAGSIREIEPRKPDCPCVTVPLGVAALVRATAHAKAPQATRTTLTSRGGRIRTGDLSLPKRALYQAELRPEAKQCRWIACG